MHVWRTGLDLPATVVARQLATLSVDELQRARRLRFAVDRTRFIVARATLRAILAGYLGVAPDQLRFRYGPQGKPELDAPFASSGLRFNLAHSHNLALYAVGNQHELGIDVEHICSDTAVDSIARHFFAAHELLLLAALPEAERRAAFFTLWVRKEAYIKARGQGLALPLDQVDVLAGSAGLLSTAETVVAESGSGWFLHDLVAAAGFAAALATEKRITTLRYWEWGEELQKLL